MTEKYGTEAYLFDLTNKEKKITTQKKITTLAMEIALSQYFNYRQNLIVPNISWGLDIHECDLLIMSKAGYLSEVEIKISAADLKKDAGKRHGHYDSRIKAFYFAIPESLLSHSDHIPERAGILTGAWYGTRFRIKQHRAPVVNSKAPALSAEDQFKVARLGALRIWSLKSSLNDSRERLKVLSKK